ncbi:MAG: ImmA/IrrE family metallo-endopeptidase [Armatimonadota bacterium]
MSGRLKATINRHMLVWARIEARFKTVEDAANEIKSYSSEQITAWESGEILPSIAQAKALAKFYDIPFAAFYRPSLPEHTTELYSDRRSLYKSSVPEISHKLWTEINRLKLNREIAIDAGPYAHEDFPSIPQMPLDSSIITIASTIREFIQLDSPFKSANDYKGNPFNYMRRLVEDCGIMVGQITGVALEEMKGISICYDTMPIIGINNSDWPNSKTFTLLHELAHVFRRSSAICSIDLEDSTDDEEIICDAIAAEALAPSDQVRMIANDVLSRYMDINTNVLGIIAAKFGISDVTALRRLYAIGMIDKDSYRSLYDDCRMSFARFSDSKSIDKPAKELRIPWSTTYLSKNGHLFPRIMLEAYHDGEMTFGVLCQDMNAQSRQIPNIEKAVFPV